MRFKCPGALSIPLYVHYCWVMIHTSLLSIDVAAGCFLYYYCSSGESCYLLKLKPSSCTVANGGVLIIYCFYFLPQLFFYFPFWTKCFFPTSFKIKFTSFLTHSCFCKLRATNVAPSRNTDRSGNYWHVLDLWFPTFLTLLNMQNWTLLQYFFRQFNCRC